MGAAHHEHTEAGLTDTAADGEGKLTCEKRLVEGKRASVIAARYGKLTVESRRIHTNSHRGDLKRAAQGIVPENEVTVEGPVIVVGRAVAVRLAIFQLVADLHNEYRLMLVNEEIFALVGSGVRIHILKLLSRDKRHVALELLRKLGEAHVKSVCRVADRSDNCADDEFQVIEIAVFLADYLLPVPLVNVNGVNVVKLLVATDRVHVGIKALTELETVFAQRLTLPFCE